MPTLYQSISEIQKVEFAWDSTKLELGRYAQLLPTDEAGEVSFGSEGKFRSPATLEFPNAEIRSLTFLWSIEADVAFETDSEGNILGSLDFQISNDGGTTWYYWNAGWMVAGLNDWSSEFDIQDNIASFPFVTGGYKQVKIKVQLSPDSSGIASPFLIGMSIHYELDFIPEVDVLQSLFERLENGIEIQTEIGVVLGAAATTFPPNIKSEIMSVVGAWNATTDPGRQTNIFASFTKTLVETKETGEKEYSQTIILTASQAINSEIRVVLRVRIYPYIAPDADYSFSDVPKYIIELGDHAEDMDFRNDGYKVEKNKAKKKARIRKFPTTYRMPIRVLSYTPEELFSIEMNRALIRALTNKVLVSIGTGERLPIVDEAEFGSANVPRENLSVKRYTFSVVYRDWTDNEYQEVPLVETFSTVVDRGGRSYESS